MVELHNEMYQPNTQTISGGMLGGGFFVGVWLMNFIMKLIILGPAAPRGLLCVLSWL